MTGNHSVFRGTVEHSGVTPTRVAGCKHTYSKIEHSLSQFSLALAIFRHESVVAADPMDAEKMSSDLSGFMVLFASAITPRASLSLHMTNSMPEFETHQKIQRTYVSSYQNESRKNTSRGHLEDVLQKLFLSFRKYAMCVAISPTNLHKRRCWTRVRWMSRLISACIHRSSRIHYIDARSAPQLLRRLT